MICIKNLSIVIIDHANSLINHLTTLTEHTEIDVIATVKNENDIIKTLEETLPDVALIDLSLLKSNEQQFIQTITKKLHIPVIIISDGSVQQTAKTVHAITSGASDFLLRDNIFKQSNKQEIVKKIKDIRLKKRFKERAKKESKKIDQKSLQERSKTILTKQVSKKIVTDKKKFNILNESAENSLPIHTIIAIGTSTGGPRALQQILQCIPRNYPIPLLIVQHMPMGFTKSLAERLNETCKIEVKEAVNGEAIKGGTAYIAPGNYHMRINKNLTLKVSQDEQIQGHRPSVNVLFESLAQLTKINKIAVILTGMGKDGTEGLQVLKKTDPTTYVIAESEQTAVIYGMPKAAIETGYVNEVHRIDEISNLLVNLAEKRGN